jgi:hypothetical protein
MGLITALEAWFDTSMLVALHTRWMGRPFAFYRRWVTHLPVSYSPWMRST